MTVKNGWHIKITQLSVTKPFKHAFIGCFDRECLCLNAGLISQKDVQMFLQAPLMCF